MTTHRALPPGTLIAEALGRMVRDAGLHVLGCSDTLAALLDKMRRCRRRW